MADDRRVLRRQHRLDRRLALTRGREGAGDDIRVYWEAMTRVQLEFFKEPGPVGTAIRIQGFAYADLLIEVEAIAYVPGLPSP